MIGVNNGPEYDRAIRQIAWEGAEIFGVMVPPIRPDYTFHRWRDVLTREFIPSMGQDAQEEFELCDEDIVEFYIMHAKDVATSPSPA